ncbi:hypothetical protein SR870_15010 [Rhodopseudomonas palustris]|uniref:hypothetical protein n=1 Tax=Rhodopseudomonas palustris TaxID=1076 RepID=UPI002ACDB263|nr:hypothetical protein [Rhodopseudomonas palustris]WQG98010.1 hypothetical protein SR870_15010 [Rhodopseudomonas palustris]
MRVGREGWVWEGLVWEDSVLEESVLEGFVLEGAVLEDLGLDGFLVALAAGLRAIWFSGRGFAGKYRPVFVVRMTAPGVR